MRKFYFIISICLSLVTITVQSQSDSLKIDSLKKVLPKQKEDTNKVNTLNVLAEELTNQSDSIYAIEYVNAALRLSQKLNFKRGESKAYFNLGLLYSNQYNYPIALNNMDSALKIFIYLQDKWYAALTYTYIGDIYNAQDNYGETLNNYFSALKLYESIDDKRKTVQLKFGIATTYSNQDNYAEALERYLDCLKNARQINYKFYIAFCYLGIGEVYSLQRNYINALNQFSTADSLFKKANNQHQGAIIKYDIGKVYRGQGDDARDAGNIKTSEEKYLKALDNFKTATYYFEQNRDDLWGLANVYVNLGSIYIRIKDFTKAKEYLEKCIRICKISGNKYEMRDAYKNLFSLDSSLGDYKSGISNYKSYILYRDSINNQQTNQKMLQSQMQYEFDKKESLTKAEQAKRDTEAKRIKTQQYFIIAALGIVVLAVIIIALIQYRNNKQKQKANIVLEDTLTNLKSTQSQLIQKEKMASLGELTAGIAHEIQNPLNFVNNFSEVNKEMLEELKAERLKPKAERDDTLEDELINDVIDNEEKINHHGKRADAIVKGMMQHSQVSTGQKESTDINALADEYLRLSFHGIKARDKNFNATTQTDFDNSIGKINIVPQDIGRVLLNLYNNAFYAVNEKKKNPYPLKGQQKYEPKVTVSTKAVKSSLGDLGVLIAVKDNGNGIPQNIVDKIFQPFFTTKPTGQGTGLGLSLSYDIIKAHAGEIKVNTKEGEGSEFIIQLRTN